jgi:thiaminase/transcriptional activator TenA
MASFSQELRDEAAPIWGMIHAHPFLAELADGTLPMEKFRFFIKQDYVYLFDFARCLSLAVAKEGDIDAMRGFITSLNSTLTLEVDMLVSFCGRIGIPAQELRGTELAPTNFAYTRHMLNVAYSGTVAENVAALLPCIWSYGEIGVRLAACPTISRNPIYEEWCAAYASEEYGGQVAWYRDYLDGAARDAGPKLKARMREHFLASSRYEYGFWEMSYKMLGWGSSGAQQ